MSGPAHHSAAQGSSPEPETVALRWYAEVGSAQWMALALAGLGWTFESYDSFVLSLTLPTLSTVFHLSRPEIGALLSLTAAGQILGGLAFGWVSDRIGRVRTALLCITVYSAFSGLIALAPSAGVLAAFRFCGALGMGGSWTAGAALVAETWPSRWRGRGGALMQMGLPIGAMLAIALSGVAASLPGGLEGGGWRILFLLGVSPAAILFLVARKTPESPLWLARRSAPRAAREAEPSTSRRLNLRHAAIAFGFVFFLQYVYWGVFTWTPTFLVSVRHIAFLKSLPFVLSLQLGALSGFLVFAWLVDRLGRRPLFLAYILLGVLGLAAYTFAPAESLIVSTFVTGFAVNGVFAGLGPFIAELLGDVRSRGFLMGLVYNGGRLGGLAAPSVIGVLAAGAGGMAAGLGTTIVAFILAFLVVLAAPETRGRPLL